MYADLVDRCTTGMFEAEFAPSGSFVKVSVNGRIYWYHQASSVNDAKRRVRKYVGPDSSEIRERIDQFGKAKAFYQEQRQILSALKHAGLASPPGEAGEILSALAEAGVFRLRAVLVGTTAFQTYGGLLGVKMPSAALITGDIDLAQFAEISVAISQDETTEPLLKILQGVDSSFRPLDYALDQRRQIAVVNNSGYRVELLVPNRGPDRDAPVELPALQSHGQPLRFLDYLIYDAVPAVVLHGAGVLVNVPQPQRYALHKLIVSQVRRHGSAKIDKDLKQAEILIGILTERRKADLRDAWTELCARGPKWREHAVNAVQEINPEIRGRFEVVIGEKLDIPVATIETKATEADVPQKRRPRSLGPRP